MKKEINRAALILALFYIASLLLCLYVLSLALPLD